MLCGLQYIRLEDLLNGETQQLRLPLEPQGSIQLEVTFQNTMLASAPKPAGRASRPGRGLKRSQGVLRIKKIRGKKLIRPTDMNMGVGELGLGSSGGGGGKDKIYNPPLPTSNLDKIAQEPAECARGKRCAQSAAQPRAKSP